MQTTEKRARGTHRRKLRCPSDVTDAEMGGARAAHSTRQARRQQAHCGHPRVG